MWKIHINILHWEMMLQLVAVYTNVMHSDAKHCNFCFAVENIYGISSVTNIITVFWNKNYFVFFTYGQ